MVVAVEGLPSRRQAAVFAGKAWGLRLHRSLRDALGSPGLRRHPVAAELLRAPVLAELVGPLWPRDDDVRFAAGKVQNLRVALRSLHGIEVRAGDVFSFWKQVGRATRRRGFVLGRELREGCLIPSLGGGLCQLSNAIYDCAARSGIEIIERHRHSRVIPGSLAEHGRDATVFWNYLDLRLRSSSAWRLEATMDAGSLCVRIRGFSDEGAARLPLSVSTREKADAVEDCHGCHQAECHRHVDAPVHAQVMRRFWWQSPSWPEFAQHVASLRSHEDRVFGAGDALLPTRNGWRRWRESAHWRFARWRKQPLPEIAFARGMREARLLSRYLEPLDTRLVVPQSLLPFLWRDGVLAGRSFDVLMTALPMSRLQQQLDRASQRHPGCLSLADFRAPLELLEAEAEALAAANAWISPHAQVIEMAGAKAIVLDWQRPPRRTEQNARARGRPRIFLAASPLARKGIFELLEAMRQESVDIVLPPGDSELDLHAGRAQLRRAGSYDEGLLMADITVLPAWIEHQPRGLLAAMSMGIPVVATASCGLPNDGRWIRIQEGHSEDLRAAILGALDRVSSVAIDA